jgi:sugar phosphate isomerase/epimerase
LLNGFPDGLHSLSAVNIAEFSPYLAESADQYLRSYIDIAKALNAGWVDVHAGYHFTSTAYRNSCASLAQGFVQLPGRYVVVDTGTGLSKWTSSDVAQRQAAGLEQLKRTVGYAEAQGVLLLLENLKLRTAAR